jgi:hypothetical protein
MEDFCFSGLESFDTVTRVTCLESMLVRVK